MRKIISLLVSLSLFFPAGYVLAENDYSNMTEEELLAAKEAIEKALADQGVSLQQIRMEEPEVTLLKWPSKKATKGTEKDLHVIFEPSDEYVDSIEWSSSNEDIVRVDENGHISSAGLGEAVITASVTDSAGQRFTAECHVNVIKPVSSISLNETGELSMNYNQYCRLPMGYAKRISVTVMPKNADNKKVEWSSSNTEVAEIDASGYLKTLAPGRTVIRCTAKDGSETSLSFDIEVYYPTEYTLKEKNKVIELHDGERVNLSDYYSFEPQEASQAIEWSVDEQYGIWISPVLDEYWLSADEWASGGSLTRKLTGKTLDGTNKQLSFTIKIIPASTGDLNYASDSIADDGTVKNLVSSCPAIGRAKKKTKDFYADAAAYRSSFPDQNSIRTWRITIENGVAVFYDVFDTTILLMVPNGKASEILPAARWNVLLLEALPTITDHAKQKGITVIAEKHVDGGSYAKFADSKGVIDLTDSDKYANVLKQAKDDLAMLEVIGSMDQLDKNGNGQIDMEEIFDMQ